MNVRDITLPEPGSTTARRVLSRALSRLLTDLRGVLVRPTDDPGLRADIETLAGVVAALPNRAAILTSLVRRPNVGALIRCARHDPNPALVAELVATLALELAALGVLETPLQLVRAPRRVISLVGSYVVDSIEGALSTAAPPHRRPFHKVRGSLLLALEDNNPLSMFEAHPDKSGNRIDLGGRSPDEWCAALGDALDRIERYLPDLRAEIDLLVQQFVPVGYDAEAHLSASYREAIGTIYLTLHPDPMTMTEAVIHEFSHNKLNALLEIDEVMHNAHSPLFKSPVRPDPRPLHGVLLAVHAFIPVARLYERMIEADDPMARSPSFHSRFAKIVAGNREGMDVLANAQPTPVGRELLAELGRWVEHFGSIGTADAPSARAG